MPKDMAIWLLTAIEIIWVKFFSLADINVKAEMLSYFIWDFIKM
jgi:hypothetical protein